MRLLWLAALFAATMHTPAQSHGWYERACCDERDCEPLPLDAVTLTPQGYHVRYISMNGNAIDQVVPRARVRPSHDGGYHGCAVATLVICLYVPLDS